MSNQSVALNQNNVSIHLRCLNDSDGTPATGLLAADAGHEIWYQRGFDTAVVTDGGSAADLTLITDAHSDWGFIEVRVGLYRVDLPDAAYADGVGSVTAGMNATGISSIGKTVDIGPFKYHGTAVSVTTTSTTFPAGSNPYVGDTIYVKEGTGLGGEVLILSVVGQVATHNVFPVGISDSTSTILLIPGYAQLVHLDDDITTRSTLDTDDLTTETAEVVAGQVTERTTVLAGQVTERNTVLAKLPAAPGPTRAEATSDKAEVIDKLPATKTVGDRLRVAVEVVNGRVVTGTGGAGDEWGDGGAET